VAFDDLASLRLLFAAGRRIFRREEALQALDPVYGYDDHAVWLVSSQYVDAKGLKLTARVFNLDGTQKFAKEVGRMPRRTARFGCLRFKD